MHDDNTKYTLRHHSINPFSPWKQKNDSLEGKAEEIIHSLFSSHLAFFLRLFLVCTPGKTQVCAFPFDRMGLVLYLGSVGFQSTPKS